MTSSAQTSGRPGPPPDDELPANTTRPANRKATSLCSALAPGSPARQASPASPHGLLSSAHAAGALGGERSRGGAALPHDSQMFRDLCQGAHMTSTLDSWADPYWAEARIAATRLAWCKLRASTSRPASRRFAMTPRQSIAITAYASSLGPSQGDVNKNVCLSAVLPSGRHWPTCKATRARFIAFPTLSPSSARYGTGTTPRMPHSSPVTKRTNKQLRRASCQTKVETLRRLQDPVSPCPKSRTK